LQYIFFGGFRAAHRIIGSIHGFITKNQSFGEQAAFRNLSTKYWNLSVTDYIIQIKALMTQTVLLCNNTISKEHL